MANGKLLPLLIRVGVWTVGGLLGGLIGSLVAVLLTESIKQILAAASLLDPVWLLLLPLLGVTLAVLVLHGLGKVLGVGGPKAATLTCLATVVIAALSGLVTARAVNKLSSFLLATIRRM